MEENELFIEIGGRRFKTTRYMLARHYEIEELMGEALGGALGQLFGAVDAAGGRAAVDTLAAGGGNTGINGAALGGAIVDLFTGMKRAGGFMSFAQRVLSDTSEIVAEKATPIKPAIWRGPEAAVLLEDLVFQVLRFNFEAYFLSRWARLKAISPAAAPASSAPSEEQAPS
jgi:hypothetical protein